ncbi:hypothetical protein GPECTOR_53g115 [Gonium pectorale]|uniref:7,8-didemethyl-8-hydroxy-5-deazariboflavin synthase n=1 Tax=Gonium pectorale TaxID=33097 RepID=A0A150G6N5_GONPE|nr:hypothetical protein GPECTOR_53g115 [Gonium pectorale]|eukprot:KXZ45529.1 hypothetical protein GPECTOR_53g115 [Gonium pectorale]
MSEVLERHGWMLDAPLEQLMARAAQLRDQGQHGNLVTFSPKVFLPLTRLCRDTCGYCTFAQPPRPGRRAYMTLDEVLQVARLGASLGCSEALLTLGDKPEERWPEAAAELAELGYGSTLEYVEAAARAVLAETGLLPHVNAGVMGERELRALKQVSASQGLMLESTSRALLQPGGPHEGCPDKDPDARLATIEAAGRAAVPYTSGILVGIGDTRADRLHALACLHALHDKYGHIQELIIQNFRAKPGTRMAAAPEPDLRELQWAAPPNLTPLTEAATEAAAAGEGAGASSGGSGGQDAELASLQSSWRGLLDAGINDWGGISPLTRDFVNPERPWPHLAPLAAATAATGKLLLPRLPVYPLYLGLLGGAARRMPPGTAQQRGPGQAQGGRPQGDDAAEHAGGGGVGSAGAAGARAAGGAGGRGGAGAMEWLDFTGGRGSVGAAVLRAADSSGFLRASAWVAGRPEPAQEEQEQEDRCLEAPTAEAGAGVAEALPSGRGGGGGGPGRDTAGREACHSPPSAPAPSAPAPSAPAPVSVSAAAPGAASRRSAPLPRPREGRAWRVAVGPDGALEGVEGPRDPSPRVVRLLEGVLREGRPLQPPDTELLLCSRGADHAAVCAAADALRAAACGDTVSYVVNRNINYTNVCTYKCSFCAFSKGKAAEQLRGPAYVVPLEEISRRAAEAWERGATEVCMQGGIHPDFTGDSYLRILEAAKQGAPRIHVHAFSPLEVAHGAATMGLSHEA